MTPFIYSSQKSNGSMFKALSKSLNFEADNNENAKNQDQENKQKDNDTGDPTEDKQKDQQLDDQLNSLKNDIGGSNDKPISSNNIGSSDSAQTGDPSGSEGMGDSQTGDNGEGTGDDAFGGNSGGDNSNGDGTDSQDGSDDPSSNNDSKANRKLTLYTEYNRVYTSVKRSVESLLAITTDNAGIKSCVAQLQAVLTDMSFIMSNFESRTEDDIMIHFTIIQKRIALIKEQLSRLNTSNSASKKE